MNSIVVKRLVDFVDKDYVDMITQTNLTRN